MIDPKVSSKPIPTLLWALNCQEHTIIYFSPWLAKFFNYILQPCYGLEEFSPITPTPQRTLDLSYSSQSNFMTFIDPGAFFDNFQRLNDDEIMPEAPKSQVAQYSSALFGNTTGFLTEESQQRNGESDSPLSLYFDEPISSLACVTETPYEVSVLGIPETGARSRTETQVRLILRVIPRVNIPVVKWLILPGHQLSMARKTRHFEHETYLLKDENALTIRARILRSDNDIPVYACYSCILRERKRGFRKRAKVTDGQENEYEEQPHIETAEKETEQDRERILIFASQTERLQMMRGDVMIPIRLTCYCRHHDEKVGFRVRLELLDQSHRIVGFADSPPILITDDHKRISRQTKSERINGTNSESILQSRPLSPHPNVPSILLSDPQVLKVVPAEGPMHGGIEITILGENFTNESVIIFGSLPSTTINFISSSTIVVRLPPSHVAGIVPVVVCGQIATAMSPEDYVLFNYKNDLDRAMMELALQLIGMKMTGRVDDARDIALRIISEFSPTAPGTADIDVPGSLSAQNDRLERVLITCLAAAETTGGLRFTEEDIASFRTIGGQTLLHLAALARFDHLFEYLGGLGNELLLANVDKNGLTPSDLYYLAGRQDFLETLGLDDSDDEENCSDLDLSDRYMLIQRRVMERLRYQPSSTWSIISDGFIRIKRKPSRIRNHMNRLKNVLWRKLASEASIKEYYLKSFGYHKSKALNAGSRLYQNYQESKPINGRVRDLLVWYFWVPIIIAALFVWYFDFGSNLISLTIAERETAALVY